MLLSTPPVPIGGGRVILRAVLTNRRDEKMKEFEREVRRKTGKRMNESINNELKQSPKKRFLPSLVKTSFKVILKGRAGRVGRQREEETN